MGDAANRLKALEEWQQRAQDTLDLLANRAESVEKLSTATDRLADSTEGVEEVLRSVANAQADAREAKATAEKVRDETLPKDEIEAGHHRLFRLTIILAVGAVLIALVSAWAVFYVGKSETHEAAVARFTACEHRNSQLAEGAAYSARLFAKISRDDPQLAHDLASVAAPPSTSVQCVPPGPKPSFLPW